MRIDLSINGMDLIFELFDTLLFTDQQVKLPVHFVLERLDIEGPVLYAFIEDWGSAGILV